MAEKQGMFHKPMLTAEQGRTVGGAYLWHLPVRGGGRGTEVGSSKEEERSVLHVSSSEYCCGITLLYSEKTCHLDWFNKKLTGQ